MEDDPGGKADSINPGDELHTHGRLLVTLPPPGTATYADYELSFRGQPISPGSEHTLDPGVGCLEIRVGARRSQRCGIELSVGELTRVQLGALVPVLPPAPGLWGYHWFESDGLRFDAGMAVPSFIEADGVCLGIRTTSADTVERCGFQLDPTAITEVELGGFGVRTPAFDAEQVEDLLLVFTEDGYLELGFHANAYFPVFEGEACAASPPAYGSSVRRHCADVESGTTETVDGSVVMVRAPAEYYEVDFGPRVRICLATAETPGYRKCPYAQPLGLSPSHRFAFVVVGDDYELSFVASTTLTGRIFEILESQADEISLPPFDIDSRLLPDPRGTLHVAAPQRSLPSPFTGLCEQANEHFIGLDDPDFVEPSLYAGVPADVLHLELDTDVDLVGLASIPFVHAVNGYLHPFSLTAGGVTPLDIERLDIHDVSVSLPDTGQAYTTSGDYRVRRWDGAGFGRPLTLVSCQGAGRDRFGTGSGLDVPPGAYEIAIEYDTPEEGTRNQVWECDFETPGLTSRCEMTVGP